MKQEEQIKILEELGWVRDEKYPIVPIWTRESDGNVMYWSEAEQSFYEIKNSDIKVYLVSSDFEVESNYPAFKYTTEFNPIRFDHGTECSLVTRITGV